MEVQGQGAFMLLQRRRICSYSADGRSSEAVGKYLCGYWSFSLWNVGKWLSISTMGTQLSSLRPRASYRHLHATPTQRPDPFAPVALVTLSHINALSTSSLIQVWPIFDPGVVVYPQMALRPYHQEFPVRGICLAKQSNGSVRRYWMLLLLLSFADDCGRSKNWWNIWRMRL